MKRLIILLLVILPCVVRGENDVMKRWIAGEMVMLEQVNNYGAGRVFVAEPLSDEVFARMHGRSYRFDCTVPREELRYLKVLHFDGDGCIRLGEMVCHRAIASDLLNIFQQLFEARYPIERMVLVDEYNADDERSMAANNSSSFNFRFISGTRRVSKHGLGLAVDINPLYNPYVRWREGRRIVEPAAAEPYADRTRKFRYKIEADDICCRLFKQHGFVWGGDWRSVKDYQHFEKNIE